MDDRLPAGGEVTVVGSGGGTQPRRGNKVTVAGSGGGTPPPYFLFLYANMSMGSCRAVQFWTAEHGVPPGLMGRRIVYFCQDCRYLFCKRHIRH